MRNLSHYMQFLKEHGRPLSEINPGSDEIALKVEDAVEAIKFLRDAHLAILGGDILSDESGKLKYTYENWYCEKMAHETHTEYSSRSYKIASDYISNLVKNSTKNCFVVFVIQNQI